MINRKPNHEIVADYWYKEIAVGQRIIDTATKQLGKIANENQLRIDYTPAIPDCIVIPFPTRKPPEDLVA